MKTPKWVDELLGELCDACVSDVKGRMSGFSCRYARPSENAWGDWLLMIAPSVMEIAGGQDGRRSAFRERLLEHFDRACENKNERPNNPKCEG